MWKKTTHKFSIAFLVHFGIKITLWVVTYAKTMMHVHLVVFILAWNKWLCEVYSVDFSCVRMCLWEGENLILKFLLSLFQAHPFISSLSESRQVKESNHVIDIPYEFQEYKPKNKTMTSRISCDNATLFPPPGLLSLLPSALFSLFIKWMCLKSRRTQKRAGRQASPSCGTVFSFHELAISALWGHFLQNQPSAENKGGVGCSAVLWANPEK